MSNTNLQILILTVGKAVIPIVNSIQNLKPDRVIFLCSKKFESLIIGEGNPCEIIQGNIVKRYPNIPTIARLGNRFQAERDLKNVQNPDDLTECYQIASGIIKQLKELHPNGQIYADYTGGTKTMSLGLALASLEEGISLQVNSPVTLQTVTHSRQELPIKTIGLTQKKLLSSSALNALRVGNFKAFADTQYIPLRPLTLIFGANSSGKSSVLHSLLLSHHAIQTGELDIHWTKAGGESVDLGGFGQYIHKRNINSKVDWAVDIDPKKINLADQELINLLKNIQKLTVGVSIGTRSGKGRVRVRSFFLEGDGRRILNMSSRPKGRLQLDSLDDEHPIIHELIKAILEANTFRQVSAEDYKEIKIIINELVPEINARVSRFLPTKIQLGEEGDNPRYQPNPRPGQTADLAEIVRLVLPYRLSNFIEAISDTIGQEISKLRYLGPFRTYPPRHFAFSRQQDVNWYAGGGYAWDILLNNSEVRQKVNTWLGDSDRMKTPYELKVRKLLSDSQLATELYPRLAKSLHDLTAKLIFHAAGFGGEIEEQVERLRGDLEAAGIKLDNPDNFLPEIETLVSMMTDVDNVSETWVNEITDRGEKISDLVLMDKRTKTPVSHRDVGIGVSQVIPILVSCYGLSDAFVAIEQPEIHLHPKLQAELGSVFAESIKPPYNNRFILETHSEHLILRLQRLIREGQLKPEDISVIYVDSDQEGSQCLELRLDEEGDFIDEWPDGFFEDDFKEIFS
ncbi:DUF3696 domain-containing protein [Dolichospermum flos-aquae]|uniref:DUF3696 domain-containing protein n=1 Tax=Dolichospermum flos-aquae LEGE 04289 TaxID=1828708 RepID=A0ACC5Q712_DOLFA|nr:DUF3696 domain-containing protein [Dolichospermum flos-aquae]MBE9220468.1 DUF3696 domain-containing protein [Dolichospermum flos-aquae LEGE 04289]